MKFRKWQDAQRSLIGKALLLNGLKHLGLSKYSLSNLKFNEFQRPYFDDLIDFNISHSGEFTLCAISNTKKVGIDIEKIRHLSMRDFKDHFPQKEWQNIRNAKDSLQLFFSYWTQKEAFLKAIGEGLNISLKNVLIAENKITWHNKNWFLHKIDINDSYCSYLSTDVLLPDIRIEEIQF